MVIGLNINRISKLRVTTRSALNKMAIMCNDLCIEVKLLPENEQLGRIDRECG